MRQDSIGTRLFDAPDEVLDMKVQTDVIIVKMVDGSAGMRATLEPGVNCGAEDKPGRGRHDFRPMRRSFFRRDQEKIPMIPIIAAIALFGLSSVSWADEPDDHFDVVTAKLYNAGYSQVHVVDRDRQLLSAYDGGGSEVLIVVGAVDGDVQSVTYVHGADR